MLENQRNWAGNYTYWAARWHQPRTLEDLQALVARCRRVKAVGTRHSFNGIADTPGDIVSLENFDPDILVDPVRRTVTAGARVRYGELCRHLAREGYALHNLASLPHISIAGACATATHGSGDSLGNLATAVRALEVVTAGGEVVHLARERDGERFDGAVVSLGGLGVVTRLTLDIEPAFEMRQMVYENLPLAQVEDNLDAISSAAYSVSLFTDWRGLMFQQVWLKRRNDAQADSEFDAELFGASRAAEPRHPIAGLSAVNCTQQMGVRGPWHERLPHFRADFTPSSGEELQSEYLVPRQHGPAALRAMAGLSGQIAPLLQISEVRTIAADDLWLSPCYRRACIAIHFTWKKDWSAVRQVLPVIEERLAPLQARPHWGKLFAMRPDQLQPLYAKLPDFRALLRSFDPHGKFSNPFLANYIFSEP